MIKIYIVTYDLNKPGQDYKELYKAIESYKSIRAMDSTWFIKSSKTAQQISDDLLKHIDENDYLFVGEITSNRQGWMDEKVWNWLNDN